MSERPRLRTDLVLVEQTYRGEQSFIVKDTTTHKYYRFRPVEVAVMQTLDGKRTVAEAAAALLEQGLRVSAAAVGKFAEKLKGMDLCERSLGERSVLLMERLRAQRRTRLQQGSVRGDMLRLRWSLGDPDRFMDRTMPYVRFCFTRGFLLVSLALFAINFVIVVLKWPDFVHAVSTIYQFQASLGDYAVLWLVSIVIIGTHELGHGYTCKYFGGQVHEMGAMLFYFQLAFFCNVNDAWTFPERKARLWVTAAGSWIQLVLSSLAAMVWWVATPDSLVGKMALAAVITGGFAAVLVNLNPLIPLDGYYALSDWLEVPNLRKRAFAHLEWLIKSRLLRLERAMPPADEREQRIFLLYGAMAAAYTGLVLLLVGAVAYGWLSRAFGALGVLVLLIVVLMMTRPLLRELRRIAGEAWAGWRARWLGGAGRQRRRRGYALGAVAAIALAGLAPWTITVTGPFVVAPAHGGAVVAADTGVVLEVLVREGSLVSAGAPLASIRNLELERDAEAAARTVDSLAIREAQARAQGREGQAARIASHRRAEAARLVGMRERIAALAARAPVAGVVLTPRPEELAGRMVSLGDTLLRLGGREGVEARIALEGAGASLAREGQTVRLIAHADPAFRVEAAVASVAASASHGGMVESRVRLMAAESLRPGMTGEASVTIRKTNAWGALWWAIRSRIRTDVLL
jgi:putative peptide zinc metalloprotease protein